MPVTRALQADSPHPWPQGSGVRTEEVLAHLAPAENPAGSPRKSEPVQRAIPFSASVGPTHPSVAPADNCIQCMECGI